MADTFRNVSDKTNPADRWFLITPGASDLAVTPRSILCTADGDATLEDAMGTELPLTGIVAGTVLPLRPVKVTAATGTFYGLY